MNLHTKIYHYYYVTFTNVGGFLAVSFIKMCKCWKRRSLRYLFLIKVDLFCCPYLDGELAVRRLHPVVETESARLIAYA